MNVLQRFFRKVKMSDNPDECWDWQGSISPTGYGRFEIGRGGESYAHRFMARIVGLDTSDQINHVCDNRRCVRPDHLYAGSQKDNCADREAAGKNGARHEKHTWSRGNPKLTTEDIIEIKRLSLNGYATWEQLAEAYGVSQYTIYLALNKEI